MQATTSSSRREFIRYGAALLGGLWISPIGSAAAYKPRLCFSTLGCPDWDFERITAFAADHGYQGIEVRGIQRELDLVKCPVFSTASARAATISRMKQQKLAFTGLGSSATLHFRDSSKRQTNLEEGKRFIDLAEQLKCPYVRVFPNNFPKEQSREETMDLIKNGLLTLNDHARGSGVKVLMETHGDLIKSADLLEIMRDVNTKKIGLIWDISNMWTVTGEAPAEVYSRLKNYIRHVHVKDAVKDNGKLRYVFVGKGEVPVFEALNLLAEDNYKGYLSFEWEKLWHPQIEEPELAFADFPRSMQAHFGQ